MVMSTLLTPALHATWHGVKPAVWRRAAAIVMDEEREPFDVPMDLSFDVSSAAADIKEVLAPQGFPDAANAAWPEAEAPEMSPEEAAKAAWLARTYGAPQPAYEQPEAEAPEMSPEEAAKAAWLARTYGAPQPSCEQPEAEPPALSPEEAAKAAWLARTSRQ